MSLNSLMFTRAFIDVMKNTPTEVPYIQTEFHLYDSERSYNNICNFRYM